MAESRPRTKRCANSVIHQFGCDGNPVPSVHGTAVASLLAGSAAAFQGAAPRAELFAADVYCGLPTGGAVEAVAAALGWMAKERVPVMNVSLVGPRNALLERAIDGAGGPRSPDRRRRRQ